MWTEDDVLKTRWQRWHARVMAMNLDALLRWTLVVTSVTLSVSLGIGLLTWLVGLVMQAVTVLAVLVGWF